MFSINLLINSLMPTFIKPFIKAPSELQLNKFILLLFFIDSINLSITFIDLINFWFVVTVPTFFEGHFCNSPVFQCLLLLEVPELFIKNYFL